jgi:hypothetical protein
VSLYRALTHRIAGGCHDGAMLGTLVFSPGRDVGFLHDLAAGDDPQLRDAARAVLDATGRPGPSLIDDLRARAAAQRESA